MILFKRFSDLTIYSKASAAKGMSTGFVPTMGALHAGHISLVEKSKSECDLTICSIFVNPVQFNNPEDFEKYPVTIEKDILLLTQINCDILFLPDYNEIYPDKKSLNLHFDIGYLENILEGRFRPGHFQGVCLVVHRLLVKIMPDVLYLGQKDYQQCLVISKMIEEDFDSIQIKICTTLREKSGLAMSSRNERLSEPEKAKASLLFQALEKIKTEINQGNWQQLQSQSIAILTGEGFNVDYLELASAQNLTIADALNKNEKQILLIAAHLGKVRLIDNLLL